MRRRDFLRWSAATLTTASCTNTETTMPPDVPQLMPVGFVSHGSPTLALDVAGGADFRTWAQTLPAPRAVLVVSAHWLDAPPTLGTSERRPLLYDFGGFAEELYRVQYAAPATADLAADLQRRLPDLARDDARPWDHGVWVPLLHMFPHADVPILQVSLPYRWTPRQIFAFGQRLAPWRREGVLVLGSGGAVHNLGRLAWDGAGAPPTWATDFENWVRERLVAGAVDDVVAFREKAPAVRLAHPTDDHFLPLLVGLGAASETLADVRFPISGFEFGSLSRLAVQWG
jgi:4,5-DOPA dioxygenase extradiol